MTLYTTSRISWLFVLMAMLARVLSAQDMAENKQASPEVAPPSQQIAIAPPPAQESDVSETHIGISLLRNVALDQKAIWTSPMHLGWADGTWLFPLVTVTAAFFATDQSVLHSLSSDPRTLDRYVSFSNGGVAALVGASAGLYLWGDVSHNDHQRETGLLAGEAVIDSVIVSSGLEYSLGREGPSQQSGRGAFFDGGDSFPSDHAAVAWSAASVIAHEYPGLGTKLLVYGLATAVSVSRVEGEQHFPSDVVVGSALGWLVGRQVYRAHHDPYIAGGAVENLPGTGGREQERDRHNMGSPSVPLDSWVYPAMERLAALGYVQTAIMGQKPWTRMECARLTDEAGENLEQENTAKQEASELQARLGREFSYEIGLLGGGRNLTANLDSVYARVVSISGPALTDGYHFGQTVSYDFGRPFERGTNGQAGGSFSAAAGPLAIYVRAEYQHAPSAPALSDTVRNFIASVDDIPLSEVRSGPLAPINRLRLLDTYATVDLNNWQIAVGRQSLSWGPDSDGSMLWSDNSEPIDMVRLVNPEPFRMPVISRIVGPVRIDQFFGRLEGGSFVRRPFIYGQKVNFKPLPFLEFGLGRTAEIGGTGGGAVPITTSNIFYNLIGAVNPSSGIVPGKDSSEMDWTFYVPKVRNYVVFYGDSYAADDIFPIENPARNPWHPGIYITRIPGIPKLDFHVEGVSTESPCALIGAGGHGCGGNRGLYSYYNVKYRDGYTNDGQLIGNTVGRDGRTVQSWFTYWLSPQNTLQFIYRNSSVASNFVPGGGDWQDYGLRNEMHSQNGLYVKSELQYEHISHYPILFAGAENNVTAIVEVGFSPERRK
jgi:membrane-associated phospholipid phosphatase